MTTPDALAQALKALAAEDQLSDMLDLMAGHLDLFDTLLTEAELLQLQARLNSLERERTLRIVSAERYDLERNQLRHTLIEKAIALQKRAERPASSPPQSQATAGSAALAQASAHYKARRYAEAAQDAEQASKAIDLGTAERARAFAILGNACLELDRPADAVAAQQQALQLAPEEPSYWVNLGVAYRQSAAYDKAEHCYQKALALNPEHPNLHASLAALYISHRGEHAKAIAHLEKAITLDPGNAIAHANMAIALASLGRFAQADEYLHKAVLKGYTNARHAKAMIDNLRELKG